MRDTCMHPVWQKLDLAEVKRLAANGYLIKRLYGHLECPFRSSSFTVRSSATAHKADHMTCWEAQPMAHQDQVSFHAREYLIHTTTVPLAPPLAAGGLMVQNVRGHRMLP
jgi:hypothetical protein